MTESAFAPALALQQAEDTLIEGVNILKRPTRPHPLREQGLLSVTRTIWVVRQLLHAEGVYSGH